MNNIEQGEWELRWNTLIINASKDVKGNLIWSPRPGMNDHKELFLLYNDRFPQFESNSTCGSCQRRVFNKVVQRLKSL